MFFFGFLFAHACGQEPPREGAPAEVPLRQEIEKLREEIRKLRREAVNEEELERLEERIEQRLKALERQVESVSRTAAGTALNPKITAFLNAAGLAGNRRVLTDPTDPSSERVDGNAFLRSAELDFRAAIDPYAEGILIVSFEGKTDGTFELDVEEGYALIKRLPILEAAPLGMTTRVGKFRTPFGVSNRLHMHDMPHILRPLAISRFLGNEEGEFFEAGTSPVGGEITLLPPIPFEALTVTVQGAAIQAGMTALTEGNDQASPAYLGHLDLFFRLHDEHTLNLGASGYWERGGFPTELFGADLTYNWKPVEGGRDHSVVLGGEYLFARRTFDDGGARARSRPRGGYGYLQVQLSGAVYVGARYDQTQDIDDDSLETNAWSVYVTYYTSEFLRFRIGFEHRTSDLELEDGVNTVLFEINLVFGAHPVEPYWVNR